MRWMWIALALLLVALLDARSRCGAQEADLEAMKIDILKRAYHMNGDSMTRYGSIDMSELPMVAPENQPTQLPPGSFYERRLTPPPPTPKVVAEGICKKGKIWYNNHRSWRCKR